MAKKKSLAELLADIRVARLRLKQRENLLEKRIKEYEVLSMRNFGRYTILSQQILKETEQLEELKSKLEVMDILLEMLELKVETAIQVGLIMNSLRDTMIAVKEFKRLNPVLPPELNLLIDEIADVAIEVKGETIETKKQNINITPEAESIIEQAQKLAKERLAS
ncbi:MAG: hypothetical protein OWQ54_01155 [Sulfolobaceae archaeon]|nr:hypothetical protein [Sulfolobaceae archaeon]